MKYVICDGDQTLYQDVKTPVTEMSQLIDSGFGFGIISGTNADEIARLIRSNEIARQHHILACSGASCYYHDGKKLERVYEDEISFLDKHKIKHALMSLIVKYDIEPLTNRQDQLQDRKSQITLSALGRNAPISAKNAFDPDKSKREMYVKWLREQNLLPEDRYDVNIGGTTSLDITLKGMNKAYGIRRFADYNNVSLDEILFIGDKIMPGGNDFSVTTLPGVRPIQVSSLEETLDNLLGLKIAYKGYI